jgi:hypothetical protein
MVHLSHAILIETRYSLLMFSSEVLDLGLEQEVIDVEGNVGDGEDKDLDSEQEDLARNELHGGGPLNRDHHQVRFSHGENQAGSVENTGTNAPRKHI